MTDRPLVTEEQARALLDNTTPGPPPQASDVHSGRYTADLIAAAPDLAETVLVLYRVLETGDYCEHGVTCSGTGPDCARAGTPSQARHAGWAEGVAYGNGYKMDLDVALERERRLREALMNMVDTGDLTPASDAEWLPAWLARTARAVLTPEEDA